MTATIHDLEERRQNLATTSTMVAMNPAQWGQRQLMERGGWQFKKITKIGDVFMTFGHGPIEKLAFIEPDGNVSQYSSEG